MGERPDVLWWTGPGCTTRAFRFCDWKPTGEPGVFTGIEEVSAPSNEESVAMLRAATTTTKIDAVDFKHRIVRQYQNADGEAKIWGNPDNFGEVNRVWAKFNEDR